MKPIKMFSLAALTASMAMAFVGASLAMAESTTLCTGDGSGCGVTHVHETSVGKVKLLANVTLEWNLLFLGDALSGLANPLVIHGQYTPTNLSCTIKEEEGGGEVEEGSGPAEIKVLKEGHETAKVTYEFLLHVVCPGFIDCSYNGVGLKGTATGPLLSVEANGETGVFNQILNKEAGGFLCPKIAKLDMLMTPLSATYIST